MRADHRVLGADVTRRGEGLSRKVAVAWFIMPSPLPTVPRSNAAAFSGDHSSCRRC